MAIHFNVFRVIADLSHTASKCILIWAIHSNKSAEGISLLTQLLYVLVFLTRYLDLFWVSPLFSLWNFTLKNFYIWSSLYILVLMVRIYPRTREREKAWRLTSYGTLGSLLTSPLLTLIVKGKSQFGLVEVLYTFSLALESVCILPQLLLLRQTTVPTVITSFYLVTLGSYRFFYILNWIVRAVGPERHFDPINFIFGVVQTALYLDFAWVYWTRQRVKLRGGGVVDSDDLRKSWIVGRVLGGGRAGARSVDQAGEDEDFDDVEGQTGIIPNGNAARKSTIPSNRWGKRGVSVSADDTLEDHEHIRKNRQQHLDNKKTIEGGTPQERAGMLKQPDEFLDEDDDDDRASPFAVGDGDSSPILTPKTAAGGQQQAVLNSGQEWGDGQSEVTQNV